jgi:tetratricopeptide (TPR) repeat protein
MKNKNKPKEQKQVLKQTPEAVPVITTKDLTVWYIGLALLLTFLAYIPVFSADFVNWDDQDYVTSNQMIRSFSDFGKFFTTTVQGNYHPLTMISLAINFAISGEHAFSYHLINLILHLINVYLVYQFILKLVPGNVFIGFTVAILFGVHPMHVESVAWVAERKDVLYSCFFLLGLISYMNYLDQHSKKQLIFTLIWFILSLASKPAAIIFPVVLFALDFYRRRNLSMQLIIEKLPFFLLSAILVYLTLKYQEAVGATPLTKMYNFDRRFFFPFYGYMMYIIKLFWPVNLCTFYPFPPINEATSKSYLLSPIFFIASAYLCMKTWKTNRVYTFGFGFYFLNLVLVLQFFMFGSAIIADRYTYIPYIGLFFILAWFIDQEIKMKTSNAYLMICTISVLFSFMSFRQAGVWKNTGTLWDSAISNYPSAKAYANRAYLYQQEGVFDKAIEYYNKAAKLNVSEKAVFFNLGVIYFHQNKDSLSLANYNMALDLKPDYVDALNGRGSLYARMGKNDLALADFNKIKAINPGFDVAIKNKAAAYFAEKKFDQAIESYKEYLITQKSDADAYAYLGAAYLNKGANQDAIQAFEQAIKIDPKYLGAYTNLGAAYMNLNQYSKALDYLNVAFKLDSTSEDNLKFLSKTYLSMGDTTKALSFYEMANRLRKN